ncbi:AAA family ATPase, partial [Herbaspirillum frisingense]
SWLLRQLAQIRRVDDTVEGARLGGEWITPQAYWRDGRGGRSVWRDPGDYQFGAAAMASRQASIQKRLATLDDQLTDVVLKQSEVKRQLEAAKKATEGHLAAEELARRSEEFEQARRQLPSLRAARVAASERWTQLDAQHADAIEQRTIIDGKYQGLQRRLRDTEGDLAGQERDWRT